MKNALFLFVTLCSLTSFAQPGSNTDRRDNRDDYGRDRMNGPRSRIDEKVDADALERRAVSELKSSLQSLKDHLSNTGYVRPLNRDSYYGPSTRGSQQVDKLWNAIFDLESSMQQLMNLSQGPRNRQTQGHFDAQLAIQDRAADTLVDYIAGISRRDAGLINPLARTVKAVGAMKLAFSAPIEIVVAPGPQQPQQPQLPNFGTAKIGMCTLSFTYSYSNYAVSGDGRDVSEAMSALYNNCGTLAGSGTIAACRSNIAQAKCIDTIEIARRLDSNFSRFAACTVSVTYSYSNYTANGAGPHVVAAMSSLWDNCKSLNSSGAIEACRQGMTGGKASCVVR